MPDPEEILDQCVKAIRAGRDPEEVLRKYPDCADEVRPLLDLVPALEKLPGPQPTLASIMRTMARTALAPNPDRRRRGALHVIRVASARIAAAVAILFVLGWGASAISSNALPGDLLYPIKLLTERVRFHLALNPMDKAELRIVFSEKRLAEALRRHQRGDGIDRALLQAMLDEAQKALDETKKLPKPTRDLLHDRIADVWDFQGKTLEKWSKQARPPEKNVIKPFVALCRRRCARMRMGWRGCGSASQTPRNAGAREADSGPGTHSCPMRSGRCFGPRRAP